MLNINYPTDMLWFADKLNPELLNSLTLKKMKPIFLESNNGIRYALNKKVSILPAYKAALPSLSMPIEIT